MIVNAHLFSPRYAPQRNATPFQKEELDCIMARTPMPQLVLGDLNCRRGTPAYQHLESLGYVDSATCADLPAGDERSTDHVFVAASLADRVRQNRFITGAEFDLVGNGQTGRLSDHCPVLVELRM